ncbi:MAG: NAD(P)/FAD-dependent oxidoreductase, partial [Actinobacteria bacterium]|nr:NAD(P)/FAD-dependent oxidoreductase [Actinomycetota bacterium]
MDDARRWAIVGGGVLGLTLALRLNEAGHDVTVIEAAGSLGGLASPWRVGDVVWDRHYHVTLLSDVHLRRVLRELGLESGMQWVETKTGYYADGRLSSVSNTLEFLRLPSLGAVDKARLGATILAGSRIRDWQRMEQIPVAEWLTRWSGRRTFERFWLPLLRAKLGESYKDASAAFIWATIQRLYAARRTGLKKEMFGYVPGGYARILDRFAEILSSRGVELLVGHPVERIARHDGADDAVSVQFRTGEVRTFDSVVVTASAPVAARLCDGLAAHERRALEAIRYQGIVCTSVLLRQSLSPYYLTYITDDVPFTAVVEMSAFVDRSFFGGHALVYLPKYVAPDDPLFSAGDDEIESRFVDALLRMYPALSADDVIACRTSRVRQVF